MQALQAERGSSETTTTSPKELTGLTYNTNYQVRVRAKNGSTTGSWSDTKTQTTSLTLVKVSNVVVSTGTDDTKLSVAFDAQNKATNYDIWHCTGACTSDSDWTKITSTTSPKVISGLTHNTEYKVKVRAKTASLTGDWSDIATHTTSLTLTKVAGVSVSTGDADEKLSVAWTTQSKATSYDIEYRLASSAPSGAWSSETATASPKVITGLTHDTQYQVRVRAKTSSITGDWSDIQTQRTSFTLTLADPSAPVVERTTGYQGASVTVVWTAVQKAGGYDVQYKETTQQESDYITGEDFPNRGITATGLKGKTSYDFRYRARATNHAGTVIFSDWSAVTTKVTGLNIAKPSNFEATVASTTQIDLDWDDISGVEDYLVQHCKVTSTEDCVGAETVWTDYSPNPTTSQLSYTGLTTTTTYKFRARGEASYESKDYYGRWADVATATTRSQLGKVAISSVAAASSTSLKVVWGSITGATGYIVEHKTGRNIWTKTTITSGATTTTTITGLTAATEYSVRVRATSTSSTVLNGHWSDITTATTLIAQAQFALSTSQTSASHIKVQWSQVGTHLTYQIRYKKNQGTWSEPQDHTCSSSCSTITYNLTDRVGGTRYDIQVRVKTSSNVGEWSDAFTYTTPLDKVSISSTGKTISSITLNWSAVSQATSYEYQYKADGDTNWSTTQSVTTTTVTIPSLDENKTYKARVRAKNAITTGAWSDEQSITTNSTFSKVAGVTVSQGTDDTKLSVAWTTQSNATGYDIEYRTTTSAPSGAWSSATSVTTPKVIESLTANTSYQVRVRAKTSTKTGPWSVITTKATSLTIQNPAGFPTVTNTQDSDSQLNVRFSTLTNATSYDLQYCKFAAPDYCASAGSWSIFVPNAAIKNGNGSSITGLERNTRYQVRYRGKATNLAGTVVYSNWSTAVTQATHLIIVQPDNLTLTPAKYSIAVDWSDITGAKNYEVQYCTGSCNSDTETSTTTIASKWKAFSTSLTQSQVTLSSLLSNVRYYIRVRGTGTEITGNTTVYGEWSDILNTRTILAVANPTGALPVSAVAGSASQLKVTFSTLANATKYEIRYCRSNPDSNCGSDSEEPEYTTKTTTTSPYTIMNLKENTEYSIQYRGTVLNAQGTKITSSWSNATTIATNLILEKPELNAIHKHLSVKLDWDSGTGETGYEVQYCTGSCTASTEVDSSTATNKWKPVSHTTADTEALVDNLTLGTTYKFRVRAKGTEITGSTTQYGAWSDIASAVAKTQLGKASGVSATGGIKKINVSWDAVTGAGGYRIRYRIIGDQTWNYASVSSSVTSTTLTQNVAFTVYQVQVKATITSTTAVDGEWSDIVTANVRATVENVVVSDVESNSVSLSWDAVRGATSYQIVHCAVLSLTNCFNNDGITLGGDSVFASLTTTSTKLSNLLPGVLHYISVRAKSGETYGEWASLSLTTTNLEKTKSVRVLRTTDTTAQLMWGAVPGGRSYDVWHCAGSCTNDSDWTKTNVATTRITLSNLAHGTTYKIKIRVSQLVPLTESRTYGPWSDQATATTTLPVASNVQATPAVDSLGLAWDAVTGATSYRVRYRDKQADGSWGSWAEQASATDSATITGLTPATEYGIKVWAIKGTLSAPRGATNLATTLPAQVQRVRVTKPADTTKLQVSWAQSSINAGTRYYQVRYRKSTATTWSDPIQVSNNNTTLSSLDATATYYIQVRVKLAFLNTESGTLYGAWSDTVSDDITISQIPVGSMRAGEAQNNQVTLSWTALQNALVTGYEVRYCIGACLYDADWTIINSGVSNTGTAITGLEYDTIYKVQVRGKHTTQTGVSVFGHWSKSKNITTGFALGKVSGVTVNAPTNSSLNVSWSAIPNATAYRVGYKSGNGNYVKIDITPGSAQAQGASAPTSTTLSDLLPGTTYTIRVRAQATKNNGRTVRGDWSETTTGATTGSFASPKNLRLSASNTVFGGIRAEWKAVAGAEEYEVQYCLTQCAGQSVIWTSLTESPTTRFVDFSATFETL